MIKGVSLTQEFNNQILFKEINFSISSGEKIGLIGRNGTGKSTLLKIMTGQILPTKGKILVDNEKFGYLTQEFDFKEGIMVGEYMEEICEKEGDVWTVHKILGQLGLDVDIYELVDNLSGGERMRLKLASILYENPTTLLMDEPTNHLDIAGIAWLKTFLHSFRGTVIVISHDRDLLNSFAHHILEIDQNQVLRFKGNYDDYIALKQTWIEKKEMEYNRFVERKKKLETLLKKAQVGIIRSRSGNATEAAKKRLDREVTKRTVDKYEKKAYAQINIAGSVHDQKLVLRVSNLKKYYGDRSVLEDIDFEIRGKEKIWLFGQNGVGKTTLVKCILGLEAYDSGQIKIGENVRIGYFEQKQKPMEDEDRLIDYYQKNTNYSYYQVPKVLERYLFTQDDLLKPVRLLSPGQQARLKFSLFSERSEKEEYQFLILDEPAQHLDIETKEVVEKCIDSFKGAVLLISHDVYSIEQMNIDRVFRIQEGVLQID